MTPERGLRNTSVNSTFSGVSMMRTPIGSLPAPSPSIGTQMPPLLFIFGTVFASTTRTHGVHLIAPKYSAACFISSGVSDFAIRVMRAEFALRGSALFRRSLRKSTSCCMKYETGRPDTLAFSGRPLPFTKWHVAHAVALGSPVRPLATMFGIGGWSSGNQSVVPAIRLRGICLLLPGSVLSVVSVCAGLGGRVSPGASGGGGGAIAYAQSGIWVVVAARRATVTTNGNAARTTRAANLRIKSLHSSQVKGAETIRQKPGSGIWDPGLGPYTVPHENHVSFRSFRASGRRGGGGRGGADRPGGAEELRHRPVAPERAKAGCQPRDQCHREDP